MEDLVLAVVTLVASVLILGHALQAGLDASVVVACLASMPLAGYLAYERGRSQQRWVYAAAVIGPLAIPLLYLMAAISRCGADSRPSAGSGSLP